jgi:hypothetical protein
MPSASVIMAGRFWVFTEDRIAPERPVRPDRACWYSH